MAPFCYIKGPRFLQTFIHCPVVDLVLSVPTEKTFPTNTFPEIVFLGTKLYYEHGRISKI